MVIRTRYVAAVLSSVCLLASCGGGPEASSMAGSAADAPRQGGIAVSRTELPVRQRLHVESGLPAVMTEGDRLEVPVFARNHGTEPRRVRLSLSSDALEVTGEPQEVTVPPDGAAAASFTVSAARAGAWWRCSDCCRVSAAPAT